jgi:uncharacterized protein YdaU (DUF1376 family)
VRAELPWYAWYPSDWLSRSRGWSAVARGLYRELLDVAWERGTLPMDAEALRQLVAYTPREWRAAWPAVEREFPARRGGRVNAWVEAQRDAALARLARRRAASQRANAARWGASESDANRMRNGSDSAPLHSHSYSSIHTDEVGTGTRDPGRSPGGARP